MLGISVYLQDLSAAPQKIKQAAENGFQLIFSSLHIPEGDPETYFQTLSSLGALAKSHNMQLIMDISEKSLHYLKADYRHATPLTTLGVTGLRIDDGVAAADIASLSQQLNVYLNASTITASFLQELAHYHPRMEAIEAFHNYYPKPGTGLSKSFFTAKNAFLKEHDLRISAFIPGDAAKRFPLHEGLPTLEAHRYASPYAAFLELKSLGIDDVYIGDAEMKTERFYFWKNIRQRELVLPLKLTHPISPQLATYLTNGDCDRPDTAADFVRLRNSRSYFQDQLIPPQDSSPVRETGAVTMDNSLFGRYQGEVMISKKLLPPEPKTNIIGYIDPVFHDCLPYAAQMKKIRFLLQE
ncbi:MupG family TIM beta-alpha barrel fold protein [Listeria grayi]|uniref:MupG family TIM beta-alpha barrel fold protein n=1 Tax=Listeria grayi TaxID=1641 RepID=UPI001624F88D|nr:MupG family TIM beta-alpha barrel fold protein [Listeria grayi]MBC1923116.1 DUF871 domain-containing protein [Listeria grayi]